MSAPPAAHQLSRRHSPAVIELTSAPEPVQVCQRLSEEPHVAFLDSGMQLGGYGDFSFLTCRPSLVLRSTGRSVETSNEAGQTRVEADPFELLRQVLAQRRRPRMALPAPFTGGAVGYLGYDLGRLIERLPDQTVADIGGPELYLCFYDAVYAYDHRKRRGYLCGERDCAAWEALERAAQEGAGQALGAVPPAPAAAPGSLASNFTPQQYRAAIARAIEYIHAGDIFQVNLSQRFGCDLQVSPWDLYTRVRSINPAPFAAYLGFEGIQVVSASPERFLRVSEGWVQTRPIKGTRRRGRTAQEDAALAAELLASEKDRAELVMIVDLERNDLGRVCRFGTVRVPELIALESYPTVHHLVSTAQGQLREDRDIVDLLRATFPGGSITGAPKVRSMEIIEELEPTRRGVYTGSIGYIGDDGEVDLSIAIRTLVVRGARAYFQVGGGIVADSRPEAEYVETLHKGRALARALGVEDEAGFHGAET